MSGRRAGFPVSVESDHAAEIFRRIFDEISRGGVACRVHRIVLVQQSDGNQRVEQKLQRARIASERGGELRRVTRMLKGVEDAELDRGLDRARLGVGAGESCEGGKIHLKASR
jgi:hypothetical protein